MVAPLPPLHITPGSANSIGHDGAWVYGPNDTTWPAANRAIFIPFRIAAPMVVRRLGLLKGAGVSGNFDLGVYGEKGNRLVSTGSTPDTVSSNAQFVDVNDTVLTPGLFYMAMAADNTTLSILSGAVGTIQSMLLGMAQQSSAFPLPATATFARIASGFQPHILVEGHAV